jgi:RNA polymerase sigma factor (TIGR02999 family)
VPGTEFGLLLEKVHKGDGIARNAIYGLAFQRLRGIASSLLRCERFGHTLQPTALVSEAFLKLRRMESGILNEDHFFRVAARAMRQVLIDYARVKGAAKHVPPERIPVMLGAGGNDVEPELRMAVRSVFEQLRAADPAIAATVWLRSVEGLSLEEVCRRQGRKMWRVRADYEFGLAWMSERLRINDQPSAITRG